MNAKFKKTGWTRIFFWGIMAAVILAAPAARAENAYIWPQEVISSFSNNIWQYGDFTTTPCLDRGTFTPVGTAGIFCGGIIDIGASGDVFILDKFYVMTDSGGAQLFGGDFTVNQAMEVGNGSFTAYENLDAGGQFSVGGSGTLNANVFVCGGGLLAQSDGTINGTYISLGKESVGGGEP